MYTMIKKLKGEAKMSNIGTSVIKGLDEAIRDSKNNKELERKTVVIEFDEKPKKDKDNNQ